MAWNKVKILEKIYNASEKYGNLNPQQLDQIQFALERTDEEEAFDALFSILSVPARYKGDIDHEYAGHLLYSVKPRCPLRPHDTIWALTLTYSLSVEQIPYYFAWYFGKEAVLKMLDGMKPNAQSEDHRRSIDTWVFWLKSYNR